MKKVKDYKDLKALREWTFPYSGDSSAREDFQDEQDAEQRECKVAFKGLDKSNNAIVMMVVEYIRFLLSRYLSRTREYATFFPWRVAP